MTIFDMGPDWHPKRRKFPRFRRSDESVRYVYRNTNIPLVDVRKLCKYCNWHISFKPVEKRRLFGFVVALLNLDVSVADVEDILGMIFDHLEVDEINKALYTTYSIYTQGGTKWTN